MNHNIQTIYYSGKRVIKVNSALFSNNAVLHCVNHMQLNHYKKATCAEVFDSKSGILHAVIKRNVTGIAIAYKREIKERM